MVQGEKSSPEWHYHQIRQRKRMATRWVVMIWLGVHMLTMTCHGKPSRLPNVEWNLPVELTYFNKGFNTVGLLSRYGRESEFLCSWCLSWWRSQTYLGQTSRKCLTVSTVMPLQCGQDGHSTLQIQNKCWFNLMCPIRSWMSMDAGHCPRSWVRQRNQLRYSWHWVVEEMYSTMAWWGPPPALPSFQQTIVVILS